MRRGARVMVADEMGLGKTVQAIGIAAGVRSSWPLLIVCPSSLRLTWRKELLQWLPGIVREGDIHVARSAKDATLAKILILSYDLAAKDAMQDTSSPQIPDP